MDLAGIITASGTISLERDGQNPSSSTVYAVGNRLFVERANDGRETNLDQSPFGALSSSPEPSYQCLKTKNKKIRFITTRTKTKTKT